MLIKDIVELYVSKKMPDGYFYGYTFGLNKFKILSAYTQNGAHTAFVLDCKTGLAGSLDGYRGQYFLTAKEAVEYEIRCGKEVIVKREKEIEQLKILYKNL